MAISKKQRKLLMQQHCGVINEDDAVDPRHYFYNKRKSRSKFRKVYQLCQQVFQTLQHVIHSGSPLLDAVSIVDVLPAPDSKRLLVIVGLDLERVESATDVESILECLQYETPRLRAEIARSINRRKTPILLFEVAKLG